MFLQLRLHEKKKTSIHKIAHAKLLSEGDFSYLDTIKTKPAAGAKFFCFYNSLYSMY